MKLHILFATTLAAALSIQPSFALDQITRPYQSVRSAGMGGVRITTGLYDENFFGNPARVTANPKWKIQLPDPMVESTLKTIGAVGDLVGGEGYQGLGDTAGKNLHGRIQMVFPAAYIPSGKNAFAFGLLVSSQFDIDLRQSSHVEPDAVTDIGPAITYGRKLLENDALSVGATVHATYRLSAEEAFTVIDLMQGDSVSPLQSGGDGAHVDFSLGATYRLPWVWQEFEFNTGASINNVLGGKYSNLGIQILDTGNLPVRQPRAYNIGFSAERKSLWVFEQFVVALEFTDIGNLNGSFFKSIHIGSEAKWKLLSPRLGLNQGYLAAGIGFDFKALKLDLAYYGEEIGLTTGDFADRRIALRLGFEI